MRNSIYNGKVLNYAENSTVDNVLNAISAVEFEAEIALKPIGRLDKRLTDLWNVTNFKVMYLNSETDNVSITYKNRIERIAKDLENLLEDCRNLKDTIYEELGE